MTVRTWTRRKIVRLWAFALTVQLAMTVLAVMAVERSIERASAPAVPSGAVVRSDSVLRAWMDRLLRDSLGIVLQRSGDTVVAIELTPRGDSIATALKASFSSIGIRLGPGAWALLIAAGLLFISPLLIASVLSLRWRRAQSRLAEESGDA